jgi:hypothetical protein
VPVALKRFPSYAFAESLFKRISKSTVVDAFVPLKEQDTTKSLYACVIPENTKDATVPLAVEVYKGVYVELAGIIIS